MKKSESLVDELRSIVDRWQGKRILVLGDVILDEFIFGRTDRVSREAPVVIVRYDGNSYSPGGAANAAQNLAALGARVVPIGLIGRDEAGERLKMLLGDMGMPVRGLLPVRKRFTTAKVRVMAGDYHAQKQQIVRIDREQNTPISGQMEDRLLSIYGKELKRIDAVILSDYNQGLFTERIIRESIGTCRKSGIPVVADSRFGLNEFKGVTAATPNEIEASIASGIELTGNEALERIGRKLLGALSASSILVTRGKFGMSLFERRRKTRSVEVVGSPEATDVTGAGDTVASAVILTLASGGSMYTAMCIANIAASVVVMKRGTAVARVPEILGLIDRFERSVRR